MELLALLVPFGVTLFVLLAAAGWLFPRATAGVLLTVTAAAVAVVTSLELEGAGLAESYAYVAGFALAQPVFVVLMTLPGRFDACDYWRLNRIPTIALDIALVVGVGAVFGAATVLALSNLSLLAGDRGTAALGVVSASSLTTFALRTRRFQRENGENNPTSASL